MKRFVNAENIRNNSFKIAKSLFENQFRPTIIYAVLRGGVYVANPIHEYYLYKGYDIKYGVIRAKSYQGCMPSKEIKIEYFQPSLELIKEEDRLLIVEDIIDTRRTLTKIIEEIESKTPLRRKPDEILMFKQIVVVCNDYKNREIEDWKNKRKTNPDCYVNHWNKDDWVHYTTHELIDLKPEEIKELYGGI